MAAGSTTSFGDFLEQQDFGEYEYDEILDLWNVVKDAPSIGAYFEAKQAPNGAIIVRSLTGRGGALALASPAARKAFQSRLESEFGGESGDIEASAGFMRNMNNPKA